MRLMFWSSYPCPCVFRPSTHRSKHRLEGEEYKTDKEVIVEFEGTTTEIVKKKIRFEEDVDFENPSEDLKKLLFKEFLSQSFQNEFRSLL